MAIQVVEFSNGGTKLERFLPEGKLLNFKNWINHSSLSLDEARRM